MRERSDLIELGRIGAAQGLKGEVRVQSFCADPAALGAYGPLTTAEGRSLEIAALRPLGPAQKGLLAVRFKGVDDRTAAEALNGFSLFVAREKMPEPEEEEFYYADLLGLRVQNETGEEIGRVAAVHDFGAGDVLEVRRAEGGVVMVPFTRAALPEIVLKEGFLRVDSVAAGLSSESEDDQGPA